MPNCHDAAPEAAGGACPLTSPPRRNPASRLWAITCLFNPAGYRIRADNYRAFRQHLEVPLVAVELAFDEPFCLREGDAETLIQIRGGGRMWQKERLLNVALRALPAHCDRVMWIDADVIVPDPLWPEAVTRALDHSAVLQPFSTVRHLAPPGLRVPPRRSTVAAMRDAGSARELLEATIDRGPSSPCSGFVWAARREILNRHGFYDGCIVGGGDTAFLCAVCGYAKDVLRLHHMAPAQGRRYLGWAEALHKDVQGDVNCLPHEVQHCWHGRLEDRRARERHFGLCRIGFDPFRDLVVGENGAWHWGSNRPELHQYVADYFAARNEDADPAEIVLT
ncbi:MAG TPA: hypothetical protein VMU04_25670 [Candidatus Acidoferrum sp.]|nr:hypothetical protein [Candidatus Acidoferrum sp.]